MHHLSFIIYWHFISFLFWCIRFCKLMLVLDIPTSTDFQYIFESHILSRIFRCTITSYLLILSFQDSSVQNVWSIWISCHEVHSVHSSILHNQHRFLHQYTCFQLKVIRNMYAIVIFPVTARILNLIIVVDSYESSENTTVNADITHYVWSQF